MRLLLTSAGIKNASIHDALVELLGKPIAETSALCIPTTMYGYPMVGPGPGAWRFISGRSAEPMCELGWQSLGVLELTALPSIDEERWVPKVRETDVLLVAGGDALYLCPHLDHEMLPENSMADAERWAAGLGDPAYAIDDQTAIKVADGAVEVVSEGHWKLFTA
jgi:dipeptidase E